jgi:outer membrane protein TolC
MKVSLVRKLVGAWALALVLAPAFVLADPSPDQPVPDRLDLKGAIAFALENNFDIRQARERIRQQEGLLVEIRARNIPNVVADYNYSKFDKNRLEPSQRASDQDWSIDIEVRQNIFSGGSVSSAVSAQKYRREAALLELRAVINQALLNVREQFYGVLLAQKQIAVAEQSLNLLEEQLRTVQDRYNAGAISKFDLLRAQVAVANGRPPLIRARNAYRLAIEQLRQVLGFTNSHPGTLTKTPEFLGELTYDPVDFDLNNALQSARANRPELQQLAKLSQAAQENVSAERGNYWPSLSAGAGYEVRKASSSNDIGDTRDGWILGLQGSWAIFDGRATAGRVAQARSVLAQTNLSTGATLLAIDVEVRRNLSSLQEAVELVTASKAVVGQAEESVRLAKARFDAGTATQLDVLEAQVALTDARTNEVEALYNHTVAVARVRKAIGVADAYASPN